MDLHAAFKQLQLYTPALEYPPLLIVSDIGTIIIHTAFTGTVPEIHILTLDDLADPQRLQLLKWAFSDPEKLRPGKTTAEVTEQAASQFAQLAQKLRERGHEPHQVAHFLNRLLFCFFAEDVGLLPKDLFIRLLENTTKRPELFSFPRPPTIRPAPALLQWLDVQLAIDKFQCLPGQNNILFHSTNI